MKKTIIKITTFILLLCLSTLSFAEMSDTEIQTEMQKALTEIQNKRFRNAVGILNALIAKAPRFEKAKYLLGKCYALLYEYDNASRIFGIILSQTPEDPYALMEAGSAALYMYQFERAKYYYTQLERLAPNSPYPVFGLIQIALVQGKFVQAKEYVDRLFELRNSFANAPLIMAFYKVRLLMYQHLVTEAFDLLERLEGEIAQGKAAVLLEKSSILLDMSNLKLAETNALKAYNDGLQTGDAFSNLITIYIRLKKFEEARNFINGYKEKVGEDFRYYYFLGLLHIEENRIEQAVDFFLRSIARNRYFVSSYLSLIDSYIKLGKHELSVQWSEQTTEIFGQVNGIKMTLAKAFYKAGQKSKSIDIVKKLVTEHNRDLTLLINASYFLWTEARDYKLALKLMTDANGFYPDNDRILNNLAYFYATVEDPGLRNPGLALQYAEKVVKRSRRLSAVYLDTLAAAYFANGQKAIAIKTQQEVLEMNPADEAFVANLKKYSQNGAAAR